MQFKNEKNGSKHTYVQNQRKYVNSKIVRVQQQFGLPLYRCTSPTSQRHCLISSPPRNNQFTTVPCTVTHSIYITTEHLLLLRNVVRGNRRNDQGSNIGGKFVRSTYNKLFQRERHTVLHVALRISHTHILTSSGSCAPKDSRAISLFLSSVRTKGINYGQNDNTLTIRMSIVASYNANTDNYIQKVGT